MSDTATASDPAASLTSRHHFLLRRLHSLSGILPVGVFVIMHLFTNFQMLVGDFQHEVDFIHATPALLFVEVGLWLSIAFHAGLGVVYTVTGKANVQHYRYMDNWRYVLQRVTGIIALVFIFLHIATLRWRWNLFGWFTPFFVEIDGQPLAHATTAFALQHAWWVVVIYVIGVMGVVYHWSNGLWTSAITWGLTISVGAQRRWGYACAALGVVLTVFSIGAIGGALKYEVTDKQRETILHGGHVKHGQTGSSHENARRPVDQLNVPLGLTSQGAATH